MTLEELEIVVKANVSDATKKLEGLKEKLGGTAEDFENISQESEEMGEKLEDNSKLIESLAQRIVTLGAKSATGSAEVGKLSKAIMTAGVEIKKAIPIILGIVIVITAIIKIASALKKTIITTLTILKRIGQVVLANVLKLIRDIGKYAKMLWGILSNLASKGINNLVQASSKLNKAMSEMYGAVIQLGNALATAVAPVIQALEPMILSMLNSLISIANLIGQVTASLFGNATTFKKATKVTTDYAQAVGKANNQLAKFDELNVISTNSQGGATTAPQDMFEETPINPEVLEWTTRIKEKLEEIKELFNNGDFFGAGDLFGKLFNDEIDKIRAYDIGQKISEKINNGLQLANGFLSNRPLGTIGKKLGEFIKGMIDEISAEDVGEFIANIINNGLAFVIEFLDTRPFDNLGEKLATMLLKMVEKIKPQDIGRAIARVIMTAIDILKDFVAEMNAEDGWRKLGKWIADSLNTMVSELDPQDIADAISGFVLGLLDVGIAFFENADWDMIATKIYETLVAIPWGDIIVNVIKFIVLMWDAKATVIFSILGGIATSIKNWVIEKLNSLGDITLGLIQGFVLSNPLTPIFVMVKGLLDLIIGFITGDFGTAWDKAWNGVAEIFNGIWDGMVLTVKSVINLIIELINKQISAVIRHINGFINKVNSIIEGINSVAGTSFSGISTIDVEKYQIPKLASGGIIAKPTPILAGEYAGASQNPEIVAPQSLLLETSTKANVPVMNAIEEMGDKLVTALNSIGVYAEFDYSKLKVGLDNENYRVGGKLYGV